MAGSNYRDPYSFDTRVSAPRLSSGLPGLLQQAIMHAQPGDYLSESQMGGPGSIVDLVSQHPQFYPVGWSPVGPDLESEVSPKESNVRRLVSRPQVLDQKSEEHSSGEALPGRRLAGVVHFPSSLFSKESGDRAPLSSESSTNSSGPACVLTPGSEIASGTKVFPLLGGDAAAEPSDLIKDLWQSLSARRKRKTISAPIRNESDAKNMGDKTFSRYPYCDRRYKGEVNECSGRAEDGVIMDYVRACYERAIERMVKCNKNRGMPDLLNEPWKWSDLDEEESFNTKRPYLDH